MLFNNSIGFGQLQMQALQEAQINQINERVLVSNGGPLRRCGCSIPRATACELMRSVSLCRRAGQGIKTKRMIRRGYQWETQQGYETGLLQEQAFEFLG